MKREQGVGRLPRNVPLWKDLLLALWTVATLVFVVWLLLGYR